MKIFDVEPGSSEFIALQTGMPIVNYFDSLVTTRDWKIATGEKVKSYACHLAAEKLVNRTLSDDGTVIDEEEIRKAFAVADDIANRYGHESGMELHKTGFIMDDAERYGCAPVRLIGEDGVLLIICPHVFDHLKYRQYGFGNDYFAQAQGQMLITGRKWAVRLSYVNGLPLYTETTMFEPKYAEVLEEALLLLIKSRDSILENLAGDGCTPDTIKNFLRGEAA